MHATYHVAKEVFTDLLCSPAVCFFLFFCAAPSAPSGPVPKRDVALADRLCDSVVLRLFVPNHSILGCIATELVLINFLINAYVHQLAALILFFFS